MRIPAPRPKNEETAWSKAEAKRLLTMRFFRFEVVTLGLGTLDTG